MRKRKLNEQLIKQIQELTDTRVDIYNISDKLLIVNFLNNIEQATRLMRLISKHGTPPLIKTAISQYIIFIVSCWETFFRDLFVKILFIDHELATNIINSIKPMKSIDKEAHKPILHDYLAQHFNFQNKQDIFEAYGFLLKTKDIFNFIANHEIASIGYNGTLINNFTINKCCPEWEKIIDRLFQERHKIIHNANYRHDVDITLITKSELIFYLFPQMLWAIISNKYKLGMISFNPTGRYLYYEKEFSSKAIPYFYSPKENTSDNWTIVE